MDNKMLVSFISGFVIVLVAIGLGLFNEEELEPVVPTTTTTSWTVTTVCDLGGRTWVLSNGKQVTSWGVPTSGCD